MKNIFLFLALISSVFAQSRTANINEVERVFKPETYGANPNDTVDDRVAVQAAVNAAVTAGGGTVYLSEGTNGYRISENGSTGYGILINGNNVVFRGIGMGARITATDATATTLLFAKAVAPYDADSEWVDHCEVRNIYFNPTVQKANDAVEIRVPYSRHFVCENVHFGRRTGLVSFIDEDIPEADESKIGTFADLGDINAPYNSNIIFKDIRGFGYYRAIKATKIADLIIDAWGSDANRNESQSVYLYGGMEGAQFVNCDFVNSSGVGDGTFEPCLKMEASGSMVPRWGKFTNCFFDSHKYAVYASAGYSNDFTNCWLSGKNAPGVYLTGTADQFRFANCQAADNRQEAFFIAAGSHTIRDTECIGVAKVVSEADSRSAIYIGPSSGTITLDNVMVRPYAGLDPSNAYSSLHIAAGPKRVNIIGGEYYDGITDLSGLVGDVSLSSVTYWLRPSGASPAIDARLTTRWANSLLSENIARAPGDIYRPAYRTNVGGVPCLEFSKGGRTFDQMRFYDENAGAETSLTLGDFTITAMVKVTGDCAIIGRSNNNWNLRISSAGIMSIRFAGAATTVSADTPLSTTMGEWVLVTWRRTGGTMEFFENGVLLDTQAGASTEGVVFDQISGFNGNEPIVGYLAEVVIRTVAESDPSLAAVVLAIQNSYPTVFSN